MGAPGVKVCVVGSGTRFLSGISYYTHRLGATLAERFDVSVILMRQLLPTRLYPGRDRVGAPLARLEYPAGVRVLDGVDWFWLPSMIRALRFLRRERPDVVVLQWWTGTVLHTYLALALAARMIGAKLVIEFHEVLDTGELNVPIVPTYVRLLAPRLLALTDGAVMHSEFDREALEQRYGLAPRPVRVIAHGPYDHYEREAPAPAGDGVCRLLYFGVIRPFKGLEDLIEAFDSVDDVERFELTVVGETWEGWTKPAEMIASSRHRDRIEFVNRYVADEEVGAYFERADAVVLPYHRSSASGPLHIAMSFGLPVAVTSVGGLVEAADGYRGAVFIPPADPQALRRALDRLAEMRGQRFPNPHSWERTADSYAELFDVVLGRQVETPATPATALAR